MHRLTHRHVQHFMNILSAVPDFQNLRFESCAFTFFADQLDISEKLHFHDDGAVALTGFAAASRHIERKMPGRKPAFVRLRSRRKQLTNPVECLYISHWIRPRGPSNRRLVHQNNFVDERCALDFTDARKSVALSGKNLTWTGAFVCLFSCGAE